MTRAELHARAEAIARDAGAAAPADLRDALGYYASAARTFDRAAEHVLATARICGAESSASTNKPREGAERR